MFIDSPTALPEEAYIVHATVLVVEESYAFIHSLIETKQTFDDCRKVLDQWEKSQTILVSKIERISFAGVSKQELMDKILSNLENKEKKILAERQKELDAVDVIRQNLLSLPAPGADDE